MPIIEAQPGSEVRQHVSPPRARVLILNQAFHPDVVSTAQHATDLALALSEAGHEVTVVASSRGYDDPQQRFPRREQWRGIRIVRVAATGFGKAVRWRRAADFASFMSNCALRLAMLPRQDLVIALTSPPLISWLGSLLVPRKARAMLFWAMDLNPDEAIAAGWLRERSLTGRVLAGLQLSSMRRARRIVALDRFMRDRMIAKGVPEEKIAVIPPWSDDAVHFDRAGRDEFRRRHGLADKFVVMYSGNHSPCHPLDTLIAAADRLHDDARFAFLFVGGGSEFRRLQALAAEKSMSNAIFLPYQPRESLAASLSAADMHVVVMGDPFIGIVHPCKIYNVLRLGTPLLYIGPERSHIADILPAASHAQCAAHGDVERVLAIVRAAAQQPFRAGDAHLKLAERFSRQRLLAEMMAAIENVLHETATIPS